MSDAVDAYQDLQTQVSTLERKLGSAQRELSDVKARLTRRGYEFWKDVIGWLLIFATLVVIAAGIWGLVYTVTTNDRLRREAELKVCEQIETEQGKIDCLVEANTSRSVG